MDINAVKYLKLKDDKMREIINLVGKFSIKKRQDPFLALIEIIISQKLSGRAANSIYRNFIDYFDPYPSPERILTISFTELRSIGLSPQKVNYIKLLSENVVKRRVDFKSLLYLNDKKVIQFLTSMKGIGIWSTEMYLIFCLGRPDVFPISDLGVRKAMQKWYSNRGYLSVKRMQKISKVWQPYRSIATWYLWKSLSNFDSIG